jgi:NADH-quinone oxidoreductase chain G
MGSNPILSVYSCMVNLYIDNISVSVVKNSTVLQACDSLGIDIPRFCFHERLLIAGNCRMCLVEIEKSPKPVASCTLPVAEGMKIFTKTPLVKKAQEGVLEFLLLNHPLDCPICDQGGECDLQDQVILFGSDSSRFYGEKRGVEDKDCGPLIQTIMTRCIHCTRCVRFSSEIGGSPDLGTLGRGTHTQIGTYVKKTLKSELSGNLIDLCPVGALTSKPYAFEGRPWDLKSINSIDVTDSCGSNIVLNVKDNKVMRVLPRVNDNINEEWISDKTRFSYDGLSIDRLSNPLFFQKSFVSIDWEQAFEVFFLSICNNIYNLEKKINIIFGKDVELESVLVLKYFFNKLNCFSLYYDNNFCINSSDILYKFNSPMKAVQKHDLCVLVNCNTRVESSMLNLHLRKEVVNGSLEVGYFGPFSNFLFSAKHLGFGKESFIDLVKGRHVFSKKIKKARNPLFIFGSNSFSNNGLLEVNRILEKHFKLFSLNVLNIDAGSTGMRDLGIKGLNVLINNGLSKKKGALNLYINTNLNNSQVTLLSGVEKNSIYCGSHVVKETKNSFLSLPGRVFSEKKSSFINLEGLLQNTNISYKPGNQSREDWQIFNAFFYFLKNKGFSFIKNKKFDNSYSLIGFFKKEYPFLSRLNSYSEFLSFSFIGRYNFLFKNYRFIGNNCNDSKFFKSNLKNFYNSNVVSGKSKILKAAYDENKSSAEGSYYPNLI